MSTVTMISGAFVFGGFFVLAFGILGSYVKDAAIAVRNAELDARVQLAEQRLVDFEQEWRQRP
jgi:hypothetical protein